MKIRFDVKSLSVILIAGLSAISLNAQNEKAPAEKPRVMERMQKNDETLAKDLNLTPEQQAHFKKTDAEFREKSKVAKIARKEEAAKLREERIKAHKSVLNAEQAAKYDELMAKKKAKFEARKQEKAKKKAAKKERKAEKKAIKDELKKQE